MPRLIGIDLDEALAVEVEKKGWYSRAQLELDDGKKVPLSFWDPVRLQQELVEHFKSGNQVFAEQNLIIVPVLTKEAMIKAVQDLIVQGYFGVS